MAQIEHIGREYGLGEIFGRIIHALRRLDRALAVRGQHVAHRPPARPLDAEIGYDIGARPEFQDYASPRALEGQSARHLHRVAETERWTLAR